MINENFLKLVVLDGGVAMVEMSNAPVNAMDKNFLNDLIEVFDEMENRNEIKVVVLTSSLKVFSAGLNLKESKCYDIDQQIEIVEGLNKSFLRLFNFPKPFVAAINGAAIAGGFFPVLCSDYRVSSKNASFGLAEVKVGVSLPFGPMEIARAMLCPNALRLIMQSGTPIDAEKAMNFGIIDELVEENFVLENALKRANIYSKIPPKAYKAVKMQIRGSVIKLISANIENDYKNPKKVDTTESKKK